MEEAVGVVSASFLSAERSSLSSRIIMVDPGASHNVTRLFYSFESRHFNCAAAYRVISLSHDPQSFHSFHEQSIFRR